MYTCILLHVCRGREREERREKRKERREKREERREFFRPILQLLVTTNTWH